MTVSSKYVSKQHFHIFLASVVNEVSSDGTSLIVCICVYIVFSVVFCLLSFDEIVQAADNCYI